MKKEENLEVIHEEAGIVCDNPACDYKDVTADPENLAPYINKPCPKCGENLLTQEDYNAYESMKASVNFINSLTPEELEILNASIPDEIKAIALEQHPELVGSDLSKPLAVSCHIKVHNGVHISDIKVEKPE